MTTEHKSWPVRTDIALETLDELASGASSTTRIEALRAHIGAAGAKIVDLEEKVFAPGVWRCARCQLRLVAQIAGPGGMSANNAPQTCPNTCGPMWRVSWEGEAREAMTSFEKEFDSRFKAVTDRDQLLRILGTMNAPAISAEDLGIFTEIQTRIARPYDHES